MDDIQEDEDGPLLGNKFLRLINDAETVFSTNFNQATATESCDIIESRFTDFCTQLASLTNSDSCPDHIKILPYTIKWLDKCTRCLEENHLLLKRSSPDSPSPSVSPTLSCPISSSPSDRTKLVLDAISCLLAYIGNILAALEFISSISEHQQQDCSKLPLDVDAQDFQGNLLPTDWIDEGLCFNIGEDDDESLADGSDDESISNKLCTFTLSQKEFISQHWYHCHTCNMIDRVGVCSICARVCHKDHDISYAKHGAFFCDCAARENSACLALVKRAPASLNEEINREPCGQALLKNDSANKNEKSDPLNSSTATSNVNPISVISRDPNGDLTKSNSTRLQFAEQLRPIKDELQAILSQSNICATTLNLLSSLVPTYVKFAHDESHIDRSKKARAALDELHSSNKTFYMTDALMLPTLGSQEGAFEDVRVSYTGEHASLIKQLLDNCTLRRVAMTSLSSPLGKRQHLVVCHEKGKITLLQLNALLRQADSSKRKLTLTRLASAPIPFSVVSIAANPFNEDVLAVCGLKECHILTFTNNGLVSSHIDLQLDLANSSDHIIKAVWIPGGQTEIAVMTSQVVKIYDLSENSLQPKYHLKLAFTQLKDITFIVSESQPSRYILIMDINGHVFKQELETKSSTAFGIYYVTSELQLNHPRIQEVDGVINRGGISLYYTHAFKMLFFSYNDGNFMASLPKPSEVQRIFPLDMEFSDSQFTPTNTSSATLSNQVSTVTQESPAALESTTPDENAANVDNEISQDISTSRLSSNTPSSASNSKSTSVFQPLCQWSEVPGHVGMIMAVCLHSNNPVIFMIKPDSVYAQEIRYLTIRSKITDATAIRHTTSSGEVRTTLILLCEDGSLRIYMASQGLTDFWLKLSLIPNMAPGFSPYSYTGKSSKKKKQTSKGSKEATSRIISNPSFPVDFFENLQVMNDVDFGGPDVLSIYSTQQIKSRLNNTGMHIVSTKPTGFSIEVINNDFNMVICAIRVQVGNVELSKSPSSLEVFGRSLPMNPTTPRWYDVPLTREESLQSEKRLTLNFGPSTDAYCITIVDSIRIYGKTKESFSWPEDGEEPVNSASLTGEDLFGIFLSHETACLYQKLLTDSTECLGYSLQLNFGSGIDRKNLEDLALELSTSILTVPYSPQVVRAIKSLLTIIYSNRQNFNHHIDSAVLNFVMTRLSSFGDGNIDSELFSRVLLLMKSLLQSKPSNLTKLSDFVANILIERDPDLSKKLTTQSSKLDLFINHLHELFQILYSRRPTNVNLASIASCSYLNYESTLQPLIELIYIASLHDLSVLSVATDVLIGFLLSDDPSITLCTRHSLIRLFKIERSQLNDMAVNNSSNISEIGQLRQQHLMLLERLIEHLSDTRNAGGFRSISLLHVILVLTLDLDCDNEVDDAIFKNLLHAMRQELLWNADQPELLLQRNPSNEVKLVIMRMFSILMSKVRTSSVASTVSSSTRAETDSCWSTFCSYVTAHSLIEANVIDFCYGILNHLLDHWRNCEINPNLIVNTFSSASAESSVRKTLPKSNMYSQILDLSPFFLRQYVKGQGSNLFKDYPQLLTEMVLRIPYQIKKVSSSSSNNLKPITFSNEWSTLLCEYLMIPIPSYIKKHVRKLITFICGSKEKYRQLRDFHFLESHMKSVKKLCGYSDEIKTTGNSDGFCGGEKAVHLNYEAMTSLVEHLKACIDIAQNRCINWQIYCIVKDQSLLSFLMEISLNFNDDVTPIVLELLQHALSSSQLAATQETTATLENPSISPAAADLIDDQAIKDTLTSESLSANLAQQLITSITKDLLSRFVQSFLLEANLTSLRWQAHNLLHNLWLNFLPAQQLEMVWVLWSLWHNLPKYGRKAAQFVDLIGYITMKNPPCDAEYEKMFCLETLSVLRQQNQLLMNHPNAHIYTSIQGLVDLDSYYLESEPCSVCNSPEIPYTTVKLSSIKADSRFTTTTQIIKLLGTYTILKFSLRISDIKRSKMVKTIEIHYNNRSVQSVVDLKNKTGIWNLARKYSMSPSQTEVKIEFTLPIVACNLMIAFSEFYENFQATSENLQCPRCSTSVSANPGVCSNCGENVFQCHKCRAINYDEKDPFLCNSCGFCKYARFDINFTAKPTCAVDPIENEEDRKKTVVSTSNLLEKADRVYRNLMQNKPILEFLLLRINEQVMPDRHLDDSLMNNETNPIAIPTGIPTSSASSNSMQAQSIVVGYAPPSIPSSITSSVNKVIQHLAHKYCVECKALFDELSKITHKVLASRRELVEYDNLQLRRCLSSRSSVLSSANRRKSKVYSSLTSGSGRCYGCATATVEHCITMLKALSMDTKYRIQICESGIINELVNFNLKNGSFTFSHEVRQLLCALTRDDFNSTTTLTDILIKKIAAVTKHDYHPYEISHIVRHDMALLAVALESDDQCWELRLRCLIKIFAYAFELNNPAITDSLIIPCLKLLLSIVRPPTPSTRRHREKSLENIASVRSDSFRNHVLLQDWLYESTFIFEDWRKRAARPTSLNQTSKQLKPLTSILRKPSKVQFRSNYLTEKYGNKWRLKCSQFNKSYTPISSLPNDWLKQLLFNKSSKTVRLRAKSLVEALFAVQSRRKEIIDLLTGYLGEVGPSGECAHEFYILFKTIILTDHWRYYLALQGVLLKIAELITIEIDNLQDLEETTLNSSLSLGFSLKMLLELLTSFVNVPKIRSHYKFRLVSFVLKGYLSLRKLVVQRTKVIDESQEMLLELLESMTTGSEAETTAFINVCVDSIRNCHEGDIRTPVFIFERLCSTIHPEENTNSEFFVSLEKDPQQEDYLQGRMLGNPYMSNEPGIGPLMKDIKNKICQDCELLALLEDDSSMELLVSNKIISLDLPVRDVYKRIWCPENHETDAMRIVYRMRGLLGDATEEFIESFDSRNIVEVDEELTYKMANEMSSSGGLEIMLHRLQQIDDLSPPFKPLLDVILKLFTYCSKTHANRILLLSPKLKSVDVLLNTLKLALNEKDFLDLVGLPKGVMGSHLSQATVAPKGSTTLIRSPQTHVVDQILDILETILREASKQPRCVCNKFIAEAGSIADVEFLLNSTQILYSRLPHMSHHIMRVLPFLTMGNREKMSTLLNYFKPSLDFDQFDREHSVTNDSSMDLFCIMVDSIERNENGDQLKDFLLAEAIVANSIDYLTIRSPPLRSSLLATSDEWKEFTSRPALKYVLRILAGLSQSHGPTQMLISHDCIPILHGLEQVSSDARVGTLAENLLEAIKQHPSVAEKIEMVRKQTKEEKKRLAMAVRERQLGALGMKANERGQVTTISKLLDKLLDLAEDTGLICNICREGYKFQPTKVLGIYTFTKRCVLDEFEMKPRKTYGYTTVTHFNTVHIDCHMSAVRSARGRDEWESAALQNANTRCNGLLPIWGPQVPESSYASALARHNTYLQDSTGYRDISFSSTIHDIRLQLLRFAQERSFSEDTGGGGPQSNLHLIPYMMQTALYVLNSTKGAAREYKRCLNYLDMSSNEILDNCYEVDSPYYWSSLAVLVLPPTWWKKKRIQFLQRLLTCNHVRRANIKPPAPMSDTRARSYVYYKSALIYFAFIDSFYNIVFKDASVDDTWNQDWSACLAEYLKNNDQTVNDNIEVLLNLYQTSLLSCNSFERYFDIIRIDEVSQSHEFLSNTLESL